MKAAISLVILFSTLMSTEDLQAGAAAALAAVTAKNTDNQNAVMTEGAHK